MTLDRLCNDLSPEFQKFEVFEPRARKKIKENASRKYNHDSKKLNYMTLETFAMSSIIAKYTEHYAKILITAIFTSPYT